jgi:hypothetical protein
MVTSADPVQGGLVTSLAHPGGNVTGVTFVSSDLAGKRLQFLKEAAPAVTRVAVLWNPDHPDGEFPATLAAGRSLGVQVHSLEVRGRDDLASAFAAAIRERMEAVIVVSSRLMTLNRARILDLAAQNRLLLVSGWGPWASEGGLLSYGPDLDAVIRSSATYVDKILKGAKPADLPVEQPTRATSPTITRPALISRSTRTPPTAGQSSRQDSANSSRSPKSVACIIVTSARRRSPTHRPVFPATGARHPFLSSFSPVRHGPSRTSSHRARQDGADSPCLVPVYSVSSLSDQTDVRQASRTRFWRRTGESSARGPLP